MDEVDVDVDVGAEVPFVAAVVAGRLYAEAVVETGVWGAVLP